MKTNKIAIFVTSLFTVAVFVSAYAQESEEVLEHAFDPFFTTKEVGAGTGLGLSTSYNIIQRHGGTLKARTRDGGGTIFEVWLPQDPNGIDAPGG